MSHLETRSQLETRTSATIVPMAGLTSAPVDFARTPTPGERAQQLMADARAASLEHLDLLAASVEVVRRLARTVADGGEVYGAGVRDLAGRLAEDMLWRGKSLQALTDRQRRGLLAS